MMQVLFRHKSAHTQDIFSLLYPQFLEIFRIVADFRLRNTIIYKVYILRPSIFTGNEILNDVRNHNNIIGKHAAHTLTHLQDSLGSKSPLVPIIVRTMMRKHHLHAQQFGVWNQQGRTDGMDMQYISTQLLRLIDGTESMDDGLETLLLRRRNRYQFHPLPFMQVILHIVRATN